MNKYDAAAKSTEALPYVETVRLAGKLPADSAHRYRGVQRPGGHSTGRPLLCLSARKASGGFRPPPQDGCPMVVGLSLTDPQVGSLAAVPEEQSGDLALLELLRSCCAPTGMTAHDR